MNNPRIAAAAMILMATSACGSQQTATPTPSANIEPQPHQIPAGYYLCDKDGVTVVPFMGSSLVGGQPDGPSTARTYPAGTKTVSYKDGSSFTVNCDDKDA